MIDHEQVLLIAGFFWSIAANAITGIATELGRDADAATQGKLEEARKRLERAKPINRLIDDQVSLAARGITGDGPALTLLRQSIMSDDTLARAFREWSVNFALDADMADNCKTLVIARLRACADSVGLPWDSVEPLLKALLHRVLLHVRTEYGDYLSAFENKEILRILHEESNALNRIETKVDRLTPPPTPLSSLHQLQQPPADFTGRADELAKLKAAVTSGRVAISGVKGMGGVGKTTLALKLAAELMLAYPDGQIRIDMKGTTADPAERTTPAKAIEYVLHSFDLNAKLPEDENAIAGLYRSALFGKRVLILADNAFDACQVAPLEPPQGNLLLVTSRQSFEMSGWFAIDLNLLPLEDARALLIAICPRIGVKADALAALCGCLPLALRLAGGALKAMDDMGVDEYIDGLKDARSKVAALDEYKYRTDAETTVEAAFQESYRLLTDDEARFWRALSVFPASFLAFSAAAVCGTDEKAASRLLHRLDFFNLIDYSDIGRRYSLHDLARDFASSRLGQSPSDAHAARKRHAAHYVTVLRAANELYLKGADSVITGLSLFDLERVNIEHGFKWSCPDAAQDADSAAICNAYCATAHILDLRQHPRTERIPWLEAALAAARKLNDRKSEGNHLGNLGVAYKNLGDARKAIEYYEKRLVIAREICDRHGEGAALGNLGLAHADLGDARKAMEYHEKALVIDKEIGDRRGEGTALGNLGSAHAAFGDARKAIEYYEKALVIMEDIGDRRAEGSILGNLGSAHAALGDARKAIEYYEKCLEIHREIGDRRGEATALYNMADEFHNLGHRDNAISLAESSLAILTAIESPHAPTVRAALAQWKSDPRP